MADSPFLARQFMRFRLGGVAAQTIPRAWLRVLGPSGGAPQILDPIAQKNRTLAAFIRLQNTAGVRVADILKENVSGRIFIVGQVQPESSRHDLLHCSEIRPPIPDEFNAQSVEAFWLQTASGFASSSDGPSEPVLLLNSMPAGTLPSAAKGNYQLVSGDFDIWSRVKTDVGSGGNVRHGLIGARHPSTGLGCYAGVRDNGSTSESVRLDEHAAATLDTTTGLSGSPASLFFVRLKRIGSRFQAFFKAGVDAPVLDSDWVEIVNDPATSFSSTDDLRVGSWGYTNNSTAGSALWHFIRNWTGEGDIAVSPGNRSAYVVGWGLDNPTLPTVGGVVAGFAAFIAPDGLEIILTKSKIHFQSGSHTTDGSVTFTFQVRRASDLWATPTDFGAISLNNTNNTIRRVFTVDFADVTLNPNDTVICFISARSGTVSERDVTAALFGTQRLQ